MDVAQPAEIALDGLDGPVRRIIGLYFGEVREFLTYQEIADFLAGDLLGLPHVGPLRAERAKAAVRDLVERPAPDPEPFGPASLRDLWRRRMLPAEAARHLGLTERAVRVGVDQAAHHDENAARLVEAWRWVERAEAGESLVSIGDSVGKSREWVRQRLAGFGVNVRALARQRNAAAAPGVDDSAQQGLEVLVRARPGTAAEEWCAELGLDEATFDRLVQPVDHLVLRPVSDDEHDRLQRRRDACIESIRIAAAHHTPLTASAYGRLVADGLAPGPGPQTVAIVFGSWATGCAIAGVATGEAPRDDYGRAHDDADLDRIVLDYLVDPTHHGTTEGYSTWAASRSDAPSLAQVRARRFGSWQEACRRALILARSRP
jgi:hypothetical protein